MSSSGAGGGRWEHAVREGGTGSKAKEVAQTNLRTILSFPCTTPPFPIHCIFAYTHT